MQPLRAAKFKLSHYPAVRCLDEPHGLMYDGGADSTSGKAVTHVTLSPERRVSSCAVVEKRCGAQHDRYYVISQS